METQLASDSSLSGLDLLFKEQLVTDQNIVLKLSGVFSTVAGLREYTGTLRKFFSRGTGTRSVRSHYKKEKGAFRLGAGVSYASNLQQDQIKCQLSARKQFQVKSPDCWLKILTTADYDAKTQEVTGIGCLQLTKAIYNFTDTQDIRLRVGYEAFVDAKGNVSGKPFGQIRENNWSFNTNFNNWWGIRYDL